MFEEENEIQNEEFDLDYLASEDSDDNDHEEEIEDEEDDSHDDIDEKDDDEDERPKKMSRAQKRIVSQSNKIKELEARINELASTKNTQKDDKIELVKPKYEDFETDDEYDDALFNYRLELKERQKSENLQKEKAEQDKINFQKKVDAHKARLDKALESGKYKDLYETLGNLNKLPDQFTEKTADHLLSSEHSADLTYYLAKNLDFARKLQKMSQSKQLEKLDALAKAIVAKSSSKKNKENYEPLRTSKSSSNAKVIKEVRTGMSTDDFIKARNSRERK